MTPADPRTARRTLSGRILLTALAGVAVVALVATALGVPLVRSVARDQARQQLVAAVDSLARTPRVTARLVVEQRRAVGLDDRQYAVLDSSGRWIGQVTDLLDAGQIGELQRTGSVSTTVHRDGQELLVEGRRLRPGGLAVVGAQPVKLLDQATSRMLRRMMLALLAGAATAVVFAGALARRTTAPVRAAAERAHRLALGERGLPAPAPATAELDEMNHALDALDRALAGSEARQREFLLSVSHEIRTPLTAIRGYAEALRDGTLDPTAAPEVGATLAKETARLEHFVSDLLALARLEADDFRLLRVPVEPAVLITETREAWQGAADAAEVRLETEVAADPDATEVVGDPRRIRQLLDGLVENALRATPPGGRVRITARHTATALVLGVSDTGAGLAPEEYPHAFERGFLRDRYAGSRPGGTGLGLSIARRLTERMGGTVAAGPGPERGTTMTVRLPGQPPGPDPGPNGHNPSP